MTGVRVEIDCICHRGAREFGDLPTALRYAFSFAEAIAESRGEPGREPCMLRVYEDGQPVIEFEATPGRSLDAPGRARP